MVLEEALLLNSLSDTTTLTMLDIFGKVFGQSKSSKSNLANQNNGSTQGGVGGTDSNGTTRETEQDDFVMVNGSSQHATPSATNPSAAMYPHLQLTNEVNYLYSMMLRKKVKSPF